MKRQNVSRTIRFATASQSRMETGIGVRTRVGKRAVGAARFLRHIACGACALCVLIPARPALSQTEASGLGASLREHGECSQPMPIRETPSPLSPELFDHGDPSDIEQLMLELINRARAAPALEAVRFGIDLNEGLDPGTISEEPKPPLAFHPLLIAAARAHSQWMLDTDTFSHTGVDGTNPGQRMQLAGYVFSGAWAWGENIAWGGTTGPLDAEAHTFALHETLFLSPGHRENLCATLFDEIGIGLTTGPFTSGGTTYNALMATQKFAFSGSTPSPRVVGVVYHDANGNGFYDVGEGIPDVTVTVVGGHWQAVTSASGGYAVPYEGSSGTLTLAFAGAALPAPVNMRAEKTGQNIKIDLESAALPVMRFVGGSLADTPSGFQMGVEGHRHLVYLLQHSTNLTDWTTVSTNSFGDGSAVAHHQPAVAAPAHFYRLRLNE